jgi:hypothetical protein
MIKIRFFGCVAALALAAMSAHALAGGPAAGVGVDANAYNNAQAKDNNEAPEPGFEQLAQLTQQLQDQAQQVALAQVAVTRAEQQLALARTTQDAQEAFIANWNQNFEAAKANLAIAQANLAANRGSAAIVAQAQLAIDGMEKEGEYSGGPRGQMVASESVVAASRVALERAQAALAQTQAQIDALGSQAGGAAPADGGGQGQNP